MAMRVHDTRLEQEFVIASGARDLLFARNWHAARRKSRSLVGLKAS
jgi:hypothetical protein